MPPILQIPEFETISGTDINPGGTFPLRIIQGTSGTLTALAGGGAAGATSLSSSFNRVSTVATALDSVALPAAAAGLMIVVANTGANVMQVFSIGTDTINGVAAATGVPQMVNSAVMYVCPVAGAWYSEGLGTGFGGPGLQTESFVNGIAAFATGGQTSATPMSAMVNRVTTVATLGDSVKLPAAISGLEITVINRGVAPMQVFGAGTDTINGVATAVGISQPVNSVAMYVCSLAGAWETDAVGQGFSGQLPTVSTTNGITAHSGGGQVSGVPLTTVINRITTVAVANDSVVLPATAAGLQLTVTNAAAANSLNIFPASGDGINALGANAAFALVAGKTAQFSCAVAGAWHSVLTA